MGPNKMAWFLMEMGGPGAGGTLVQGEGFTPSTSGSLVHIQVPQIDATRIRKLAADRPRADRLHSC